MLARIEARTMPLPWSGCHVWMGGLNAKGYGVTSVDGKSALVHRVVFEGTFGPVPDGMTLDHKCRVRSCCNPLHLEVVTTRENLLRGSTIAASNAAKTHCIRGHAFDAKNTAIIQNSRRCRECDRLRHRGMRSK